MDRAGTGWMRLASGDDAIASLSPIDDFVFYRLILDYLRRQIDDFGVDLLARVGGWASGIVLLLMTLWILLQGYRLVTGQSRESMAGFVAAAARNVFIVTAATTLAVGGSDVHRLLTQGLKGDITWLVTGEHEDPETDIDRNLAWMQVGLTSISAIDPMGDPTLDDRKTRAMWMVGIGSGAPALVGGAMLLLYEVALALFVGFGPLFVLCLLFDATKTLFHRWLLYGIGTLFSMAVLSAMVSISLRMVERVAEAFWSTSLAGTMLGQDFTEGISSQAMQQGGLGMILTTLIVTTPPIAAMFFQGTLGHFSWSNAFAGAGASMPAQPHPASAQPAVYRPAVSEPARTVESVPYRSA